MPAPFVVGADVASTDPEDAGELPGTVKRVLLHGFYTVAWSSGRTTTVHGDRLRAVPPPVLTLRRVGGQMRLAPIATTTATATEGV